MSQRELILLSPYRFPAKDALTLDDAEAAAFLNAYTALWHPLVLHGASGPPRIASPYDHENPTAGHVYALPESPSLYLPDDWDQRVRSAGAAAFHAGDDREAAVANMKDAVRAFAERERESSPEGAANDSSSFPEDLHGLDIEQARPFFAVGLGYAHVTALFEAMDHENLLAVDELWQDVGQAVAALLANDAEACRGRLQSAAGRLLTAREGLYPVSVYLVDLCSLEEQPGAAMPLAFGRGSPVNLVASGERLERLGREHPEKLAALRQRVQAGQVEICGGAYRERADSLLPLESQLWNLLRGLKVCKELLGGDVRVYGRRRFGPHSQLPVLLRCAGLRRALFLTFDETTLPSYRTTVVRWPEANGASIDVFTRAPYRADSPQTYFHLAYYLHQTIAQDQAATLALWHRDRPAAPWYGDWLELSRLAPVLGQWTTLSRYFEEVTAYEEASTTGDEFHADYLSESSETKREQPVSGYALHARMRRRLDALWTLSAIERGLAGHNDPLRFEDKLTALENQMELFTSPVLGKGKLEDNQESFGDLQNEIMGALAERLLARAAGQTPGYLVMNPCSFPRRAALELEVNGPLPIAGPLKACQLEGDKARVVVDVPALGFAWVPRGGPPGTAPQPSRMQLADAQHVRNEFFEAEVDLATGGLRGLRDQRTRVNRMAQQLVYNPGSRMHAGEVKATSTGPALGEIVSTGVILDAQEQVLAKFRQRFRAWLGRPVLELRIEIYPEHSPDGYPWHAYYGARFAWKDERSLLMRGAGGSSITSHTRPQATDYLEWRLGRQSTVLFLGGLPFQQRHGTRMLDVILVPEGETARSFELSLALDRERLAQTALGLITPTPFLAVSKGPPHVGDTGWLFHLDAPNLLLTALRPDPAGGDALTARLQECAQHAVQAELRCPRDPRRAALVDARGEVLSEASIAGDLVRFNVLASDWVQLRVEFS